MPARLPAQALCSAHPLLRALLLLLLLSADGHKLIVTSLDGIAVTPSKPLRAVTLNAGQRVGVALCPDGTLPAGAPAW